MLPIAQLMGISPVAPLTPTTATGNTPTASDTPDTTQPDAATTPPAAPNGMGANILAMLPSAQKARAAAGGSGGFGDSLKASIDASANHSKFGALASGFAAGLKASDDYANAQSDKEQKAAKDRIDMLKTLMGIQKDQATTAETARHNAATEANAATSTGNLGDYYKSLAENKADKTPSSTDISLGLQRAQTVSGFKPGDPAFESLDPAVKNSARDRFGAFFKETFGKDAPPSLLGQSYSSDNPTSAPAHQSLWQRMFGGGQPATPTAPPAAPSVTTQPMTQAPGQPPVPSGPATTSPAVPITRQQFNATAPGTAAQPAAPTPQVDPNAVKDQARAAIAKGADAAKVKERLKSLGIDDSDL